jgi:monoamine oxidase
MHRLQEIARAHDPARSPSRRRFLARAGAVAAAAALPRWTPVAAAMQARVVIVGAGLAGLSAAYTLTRAGVRATLYEGSPRLGGRCWSDRDSFADGQVAERGGELIDTTHEEIRALCAELGLPLDDLIEAERKGSEPLFFFDGAAYTTSEVDRDFAAVRPRLAQDAQVLGDDLPTYDKHTPAQRALDRMSAAEWIDSRVPGGRSSRLGQLLVNAYGEELGGDPDEISAVTVVSLLAGSPADRFSPYEESDQRYHVRGGNDQIVTKLAERAGGDVQTHSRLVALSRRGDGRYRVVLLRDGDTREDIADRVILALPFTLLRLVDLRDAGFGARKMRSINELGMGRNTKLQLQFADRFWLKGPGNGEYRLRGSFQTTWEVTRAQPGAAGILNFYSGGNAAVAAGLAAIDAQASSSLAELVRYAPAAQAAWNRRVIRNAWDRNPWSLGSYALIKPGQYTAFYGVEAEPRGHVYFAGEHTSIESQGYLNGAVESGMRAAGEVLKSLGAKRLAA